MWCRSRGPQGGGQRGTNMWMQALGLLLFSALLWRLDWRLRHNHRHDLEQARREAAAAMGIEASA